MDHKSAPGRLLQAPPESREGLVPGMIQEDIGASPLGEQDSFTLRELLRAAGVHDLDAPSDSSSTKGVPSTLRREGFVLQVDLFYTNLDSLTLWAWATGHRSTMRYEISARRIPRFEYKRSEVLGVSDLLKISREEPLQARTVLKQHGILIRFVQHGQVGRASLRVLMAHVAVLMASVSLVTTILDVAWQLLFPYWAVDYNDDVFQYIEDAWIVGPAIVPKAKAS